MVYLIEEANENKITGYNTGEVIISIKDFDLLINNSNEEIIKILISENQLINIVRPTKELQEEILNCVINNKNENELDKLIREQSLPLFSMVKSSVKILKKDYQRLCDIKKSTNVIINCNKNNLIKGLELAKKLDVKVIINCKDISILEYKNIFDNYNIEELKNYDIKILYQDENSPIKPLNLYSLSNKINTIVETIKKYNLSPLEQIMYTYDIIKNRIYKESEKDYSSSRDIDKVIEGEYIVCVGYSNLFNAILKCLNISVIPITSYEKKHQRSAVYVKDNKYNIDGIYAFDPTMDRRKTKEDNKYINNYNSFMIPYFKSHAECPDDRFNILDLDSEEIIQLIKEYITYYEKDEIVDSLLFVYNFINNTKINNIEDLLIDFQYDYYDEKKIKEIYEKIKTKFTTDNLNVETFIQVLYNTRRIEYIEGIVSDISLNEIKNIAFNKYMKINYNKLKKDKNIKDQISLFLGRMYYEESLENYLNHKEGKIIKEKLGVDTSIERDIANLRLIKVLKEIDK